ncbi:hypothetical protein OH807_05785 [Kitasatospora sp. NBC_01560]|uniref:hypothetical protein n=1 Tax=Kitasatospora sp. NBC_01560 TaxID=2975965 RepID=UPI00386D0883
MIHTIGELCHCAAGFEVSFSLAPQHATGQYLGVLGLGTGLAEAFGPALLISLCITWGPRVVRTLLANPVRSSSGRPRSVRGGVPTIRSSESGDRMDLW